MDVFVRQFDMLQSGDVRMFGRRWAFEVGGTWRGFHSAPVVRLRACLCVFYCHVSAKVGLIVHLLVIASFLRPGCWSLDALFQPGFEPRLLPAYKLLLHFMRSPHYPDEGEFTGPFPGCFSTSCAATPLWAALVHR